MSSSNNSAKTSFWTPLRLGLLGTVIFLIVSIASAFYQKDVAQLSTDDSTEARPIGSADSVPRGNSSEPPALSAEVMQTSIKLLEGGSRKLSDHSGKIQVVNLWATWCGPCRQEIPHLIELSKEYKSKGVEVIGLTTDDPETEAQLVKDFSTEFKISYPIGWADRSLAAGIMQGRGVIPQTIILGRDGKVKKHFVGFNPYSGAHQMRAALDEAVGEE
jgi:thiol-disulfide isomerase/thioredoxin